MEIKDITVAVERLEEVRGGQDIDVHSVGIQAGLNSNFSGAEAWGVGNVVKSGASQDAGQALLQGTSISAADVRTFEALFANSIVGLPYSPKSVM